MMTLHNLTFHFVFLFPNISRRPVVSRTSTSKATSIQLKSRRSDGHAVGCTTTTFEEPAAAVPFMAHPNLHTRDETDYLEKGFAECDRISAKRDEPAALRDEK